MDENQDGWNHRNAHPGAGPQVLPPGPAKNRWGLRPMFFQSCLVAGCASIVVPFALIGGFFLLLAFVVVSGIPDSDSAFDASANIREKLVRQGDEGAGVIAIVNVHGTIDGNGSPLEGSGMLAWVSEQIKAVRANKAVKAVVLQVDSPGGGLTASDLIYNEIETLKHSGVKVVAWGAGLMASGGYYVALPADGIMVSPTATVGSIGVIMQHFDIQGLLRKMGVEVDPIASGDMKDIGSIFREMTPEERKLLQDYLDKNYSRFVDLVAKNRGMERKKAESVATGAIYAAADAVDLGLADRIGYVDDAVAWAEELAGGGNMRVISYRRFFNLGDLFREAGRSAAGVVKGEAAPQAMAVWRGGA